jgi:hypothetical protein
MSATPVPAQYKERLYMHRGEPYFTVVTCPCCKLRSRLLWPARLTKYPERMFKFECGGCRQITPSADLDIRSICHIGSGCEDRPTAIVVMV